MSIGSQTQLKLSEPLTGGRVFSEMDEIDRIPPTIERLFHIFHGRIPPNDPDIVLVAPPPQVLEDHLSPLEWYTRTQLDVLTKDLITEYRYKTAIDRKYLIYREDEGIFYFEAETYCRWYRNYVFPEIRYLGPSLEHMMSQLNRVSLFGVGESSGKITMHPIKDLFYSGRHPCMKVTYGVYNELGVPKAAAELVCTKDHKIHTSNGYKRVSELEVGSWVTAIGGSPGNRQGTVACISEIEFAGEQDTYDIEVKSVTSHNYEVFGGLVVHNERRSK